MLAEKIGSYLANILPPDLRAENQKYTPMAEDGLRFGDDQIEVTGVRVCWMATASAIRHAAAHGCNVIICHEDPYHQAFGATVELSAGWLANRNRLQLLIDNRISVYRCHSPLDVLYTTDAALAALELEIEQLYSEWIARVAKIAPMSVGELAERACRGFGVDQVRVVGDSSSVISGVGISVGGMGISFNGSFQEWLRRRGADVIVTGEVDDYGAFWAEESGVAMIAVTHPACENPGIRNFFLRFAKDFEDIPVNFYECRAPYHVI
jgi:putative NIF3 family GTP cyclohydrolase 1 type 2